MNEHDLMEALGEVSEDAIEKYALPKEERHPAAGKERISMKKNDTAKKPFHISRAGIAAAIALCVGLNAAVIYGISRMSREPAAFSPGMAPEVQELGQGSMIVDVAMPTGVQVILNNESDEELTMSHNFVVYQGEQQVAECDEIVPKNSILSPGTSYLKVLHFEQLPAGNYTLYNLSEDGTSPGAFGSTDFEITADFDSMIWIPVVTGMECQEAKEALIAAGITNIRLISQETSIEEIPKNQVRSIEVPFYPLKNPDGSEGSAQFGDGRGFWVKPDAVVTLGINGTAESPVVQLPDVTGWDYEAARQTIIALGLNIDKRSVYSSEVAKGKVISTDPEGPAEISPGEYVLVTVSMGENGGFVMPDFVGTNIQLAQATADGMKIDLEIIWADSDEPNGMVISQSANPGEEITDGTKVTLTVSAPIAEIQIFIPAGVKAGTYDLTAEDSAGNLLQTTTLVCEEETGAVGKPKFSLPLLDAENNEIHIYVKNTETGASAEVGSYIIRSDTKEHETVFEDVEAAFRQIGAM